MKFRLLVAAIICLTSLTSMAQDFKFAEALKSPSNCGVAEQVGLYSSGSVYSLLEVACDGRSVLWRRTEFSMVKIGLVRGDYDGLPLDQAVDPDDLARFLELPGRVGVAIFSPHGTSFRLALRRKTTDSFVVVELPGSKQDLGDQAVITFRRVWNQIWNGVDSPSAKFQ